MNGLPYYKAYPRDFIEGTIGMPFEVKCAYRVVLDLIYMQGDNLPDDARYISGLLGCSIRKWTGIRAALVEAGKLQVSGEILTNCRVVSELETLAKLQYTKRETRVGSRKNKTLQERPSDDTEPEPDTEAASQQSHATKAAAASQQDPTDREKLLAAMGVGPDGITGPTGAMIGRQTDMAEADKWTSAGLGLDAQCRVIQEVCERQRSRQPGWMPRGFGYFSNSMADLAARRSAPLPAGSVQPLSDERSKRKAFLRRVAGADYGQPRRAGGVA